MNRYEFSTRNPDFEVDTDMDATLLIMVAPGGYLWRCAKAW